MTQIKLYQFNLSHYCEKVLWALDFKKLSYQTINLVPGPHFFIIKKMAKLTSVPVIQDEQTIIQDSTHIIDYLDLKYPEKLLTPLNANEKKEALEWEEYCDEEIGPHLRRFFYHHILPHKKLATQLLLQKAPAYASVLYFFTFPFIRLVMKKSMRINAESAVRSEKRLITAIETLNKELSSKKFLVGNSFTRADLTAASLLAPLYEPSQHHFKWPNFIPLPLEEFRKNHKKSVVGNWILSVYEKYR